MGGTVLFPPCRPSAIVRNELLLARLFLLWSIPDIILIDILPLKEAYYAAAVRQVGRP